MARAHTQVVVIGESAEADALYAEALLPFALNKIVLRVKDPASLKTTLPPALAETISTVPGLREERAVAMLCSGFACQPPIYTPSELRIALSDTIREPLTTTAWRKVQAARYRKAIHVLMEVIASIADWNASLHSTGSAASR